jgi:hypothetical protein
MTSNESLIKSIDRNTGFLSAPPFTCDEDVREFFKLDNVRRWIVNSGHGYLPGVLDEQFSKLEVEAMLANWAEIVIRNRCHYVKGQLGRLLVTSGSVCMMERPGRLGRLFRRLFDWWCAQ